MGISGAASGVGARVQAGVRARVGVKASPARFLRKLFLAPGMGAFIQVLSQLLQTSPASISPCPSPFP